jgi:hypothetical protein
MVGMTTRIEWASNPRKALHAALYLLRLHNGEMEGERLVRLLYLAERQSLIETGHPMIGGRIVLEDGEPILEVLREQQGDIFAAMVEPPGLVLDELSRYECDALREAYHWHARRPVDELGRMMANLPECRNRDGDGVLAVEHLLRANGWGEQETAALAQEAMAHAWLDRAMAGAED